MVNLTMNLYSRGKYQSQSNSIGLSGSAAISDKNVPKILYTKGANPQKFYPSDQGYTNYANLRRVYKSDGGGGENYFIGSQVTELKKLTAIGLNNYSTNNEGISFGNVDKSYKRSVLRRVRNGGSVAPPKKNSIDNPSQCSRGTSITNVHRSLNRTIDPKSPYLIIPNNILTKINNLEKEIIAVSNSEVIIININSKNITIYSNKTLILPNNRYFIIEFKTIESINKKFRFFIENINLENNGNSFTYVIKNINPLINNNIEVITDSIIFTKIIT